MCDIYLECGEIRIIYKILVSKVERRRAFRKPRRITKNNIKMLYLIVCVRMWTRFTYLGKDFVLLVQYKSEKSGPYELLSVSRERFFLLSWITSIELV